MTVTFTEGDLEQFIGTENYYRSSAFTKNIVHTDGVNHVAMNGGAWMIDVITSHQINPNVNAEEFQVWDFQVNEDHSCKAVCTSGDDESILVTQEIPYTDLPFNVKFFLELGSIDMVNPVRVILLPSEH